jgi:FlaA1/EpsC-like NDP-sugar epimerase
MFGRRQFLVKAYKLFDLLVMVVCFAFASWLSFLQGNGLRSFEQFLAIRIKLVNFILFAALILLWHAVLNAFNLYGSKRLAKRWNEIFGIFKAVALGVLFVYAAGKVFRIDLINFRFLAIFWITILVVMIVSRLLLRWGLGWLRRRGRNLRYMLISKQCGGVRSFYKRKCCR